MQRRISFVITMTIGAMLGFRNGMNSARRFCTVSSLRWTTYVAAASPSLASASALSVRYAVPMVAEPLKFGNVRSISSTPARLDKELPYHLVVGLPALSPTMDAGTLAEWYLNEGDSFAAGDAIAKIETDKAAMDFEAQDDGFVAKILVPAGGGNDRTFSF
jgi:biotin carboxyl carrier protein